MRIVHVSRSRRPGPWGAIIGVGLLVLTGCSGQGGGAEQHLTVHAAASLKVPFGKMASEFEDQHPSVKVHLNYGGSSGLVQQLKEGAPGDLFASADERTMEQAVDAGLIDGDPRTFARNTLVVVVPKDNSAGITDFQDVTRPGTSLVTCAPEVPCGAATRQLMQLNGTDLKSASEESSVTDVLGKVRSGQADAGIVYVSDARTAGKDVTVVDIPQAGQVVNRYRIGELKHAEQAQPARQFEDLVMSDTGQRIMEDAGFDTP